MYLLGVNDRGWKFNYYKVDTKEDAIAFLDEYVKRNGPVHNIPFDEEDSTGESIWNDLWNGGGEQQHYADKGDNTETIFDLIVLDSCTNIKEFYAPV